MNFSRIAAGVLAAGIALFCGCRSPEYYQDQAVQSARAFLLDRATELSAREVAYVKYNKPVFLTSGILGDVGTVEGSRLSSERSQICVAWQIPGREETYLVFGVSTGRMIDWRPARLIRKKFEKPDRSYLLALSDARLYAGSNLFESLTPAEYNRVRFADPMLAATRFPLEFPTPERPAQFSFIWESPDRAGRAVVICGTAESGERLKNWKINFGGLMERREVDAAILPPEEKRPADAGNAGEAAPPASAAPAKDENAAANIADEKKEAAPAVPENPGSAEKDNLK